MNFAISVVMIAAVIIIGDFLMFFAGFDDVAARKNSHRFSSVEEETAGLIDNFNSVFFTDGTFYEMYYFNFTNPSLRGKLALL